ncbi:peptidase [Nocardioides psychrotolerans]|uniref:Dipeptidyl aminopeptidase/acylaminoacyl peptidase n=1 Tax=Nocardioides psychrotolerans TaxID=1005945 RepID=A0A1I3D1J7_9ACTN|nr:prolyl oligopeptidase family serine peptidase [Nocardioides psychrotolerans]GEP36991.1 peptidase [Nocardioides psychrotolerans]SFH80399.1 Dipeptidyl aminopeptidase/acylaminoacyl peptidase [Nocardioides psychrotolerans]
METPPRETLPFGAWPSPLSARRVHTSSTRRTGPRVDGDTLLWLEARPADDGRTTLVRLQGGVTVDVSLPGQDVRTRFHEYGGGEVGAVDDLVVYTVFGDQRVWRVVPGEAPRPITPDVGGALRFSCFRVDPVRRVVFCLREDQRDPDVEPVTSLVRLDLDGSDDPGVELVAGRVRPTDTPEELGADVGSPPDFVADHVLSPDGRRLAWLTWNHPRMAWDGTWLWVGDLDDAGDLHDVRLVAGNEEESLEQPRWLDDQRLTYLSDATGWSLHRVVGVAGPAVSHALHDVELDHGQPRWRPDQSSYDVLADGRLVTTVTSAGRHHLAVLDPATGESRTVASPLTFVLDVRATGPDQVVCQACFADRPAELVTVDLRDGTTTAVGGVEWAAPEPGLVSLPEAVDWTGDDGATAHGFLYPPANDAVSAPEGALPPLVVTLHGGPTSAAIPAHAADRAFWTSRGFAVLDVNYAGSTGYGRAYRRRLDGAWGVADVADAATGARHLVDTGRVDGARVAITGGSAGGFTVLRALTTTDVFTAGASHFGISDLTALVLDTHKFESRYPWGLVAPWPSGREVYEARSPLRDVARLTAPLILLQGTDDRVVPPVQAEAMAAAVRERGLPVALVMFEGEGHGFRQVANRVRALESELSFYGQVWGFDPAGDIPPVDVENLPPAAGSAAGTPVGSSG